MLMKKSVNGVPPPSVVLASPGAERSEAERSDAERSVAPGEAKTMPDPEVVVVQVTCRIQPILPPCQGIRSSDHDKTTQASLKEHRMVPTRDEFEGLYFRACRGLVRIARTGTYAAFHIRRAGYSGRRCLVQQFRIPGW